MATLFIHAPYKRPQGVATPGERYSFEYIYKNGIAEGYAIWQKWVAIIKPGWSVVLLRCDKYQKRAKGTLSRLEPTGIYVKGVQRYNIHIGQPEMEYPFVKDVNFNFFGVRVIDC